MRQPGTGQSGPIRHGEGEAPAPPRPLSPPTSLQCPLGDFAAVDTQSGAVVGGHLDLVVGPDDEVLQQQVVDISICDVLKLVPDRQPGQAVPEGRKPGCHRLESTCLSSCPGSCL